MKKIAVVMSVFNEPIEYIKLSVDSILKQTYQDFDFIIVSDNPQNNVVNDFLDEYVLKDSRIKFLKNSKNIGLAMSLNKAISVSDSYYVARMDADDISMPNRFEKQINYLEEHPDVSVLSTNKICIDDNGCELYKGEHLHLSSNKIKKILGYCNIITHPSVMMRREALLSVGMYRNFPTSQDRDLWCRILANNLKIEILDEYLIKYRINSNSITVAKAYKQAIISQYIGQLYGERLQTNTDSFSEENLANYLVKYKVEDEKEIKKFQAARDIYEKGRTLLKHKIFFEGFYQLIRGARNHPIIKKRLVNMVQIFVIKKFNFK